MEKFLNLAKIKNVILKYFKVNEQLVNKKFHGLIICAAYLWSPYNLFHGPRPDKRQNDPHYAMNVTIDLNNNTQNGHDTEFLSHQTNEYVDSYNDYLRNKSIRSFSSLKENKVALAMIKNQAGAYFFPLND